LIINSSSLALLWWLVSLIDRCRRYAKELQPISDILYKEYFGEGDPVVAGENINILAIKGTTQEQFSAIQKLMHSILIELQYLKVFNLDSEYRRHLEGKSENFGDW